MSNPSHLTATMGTIMTSKTTSVLRFHTQLVIGCVPPCGLAQVGPRGALNMGYINDDESRTT